MKTIALIATLLTLGGFAFAQTADTSATPQISISFIGHACFQITSSAGTRIVCDPSAVEGYKFPDNFTADIVTISHQHFDHNNKAAVTGSPLVLEGMQWTGNDARFHKFMATDTQVGDVHLRTVECHHFPPELSPVNNAIFVYAFDNLTVVHLGDIGVLLTE
jgi:L-ascorbate metabolism protein UlaG (beta-lactamase superfamily)